VPIYQALLDAGKRELALSWFYENINFYHPKAADKLSKVLGVKSILEPEEQLFMQ